MAISLNSFSANTKIESAKVNTNFANLKSATEDAGYRALTWGVSGGVGVENEQGMKWIVPQGLTLKKLYAKTDSGTCTIRIQKNTTDLVTSFEVTSTLGSTDTFDSSTIAAEQSVTLDVTVVGSCIGLWVVLECQVTTLA